jgi:hypothetical protein
MFFIDDSRRCQGSICTATDGWLIAARSRDFNSYMYTARLAMATTNLSDVRDIENDLLGREMMAGAWPGLESACTWSVLSQEADTQRSVLDEYTTERAPLLCVLSTTESPVLRFSLPCS